MTLLLHRIAAPGVVAASGGAASRGLRSVAGLEVSERAKAKAFRGAEWQRRENLETGLTRRRIWRTIEGLVGASGSLDPGAFNSMWMDLARHGFLEELVELSKFGAKRQMTLDSKMLSALIHALARRKMHREAARTYFEFRERVEDMDDGTIAVVIRSLGKAGNIRSASALFGQLKAKRELSATVYNSMLYALAVSKRSHGCDEVWEEMKVKTVDRSINSYNFMMKSYMERGDLKRCFALMEELRQHKIAPTVVTYGILLHGVAAHGSVDRAIELRSKMESEGIFSNAVIETTIMNGLVRERRVDEAIKLMDAGRERGIPPSAEAYSVLIKGYADRGDLQAAMTLLEAMKGEKVPPSAACYGFLISALAKRKYVRECFELASEMIESNLYPTVRARRALLRVSSDAATARKLLRDWKLPKFRAYMSLLSVCARSGESDTLTAALESMRRDGHGDEMARKNLAIMDMLISAYSRARKHEAVRETIDRMVELGIEPSPRAHAALLYAYHAAGDYEQTFELWTQIRGGENPPPTRSAFMTAINMCMAKGRYKAAERVVSFDTGRLRDHLERERLAQRCLRFLRMHKFYSPHTGGYNAMIRGYAKTGLYCRDIATLREEMRIRGVPADTVTRKLELMATVREKHNFDHRKAMHMLFALEARGEAGTPDYNLVLSDLVKRRKFADAKELALRLRGRVAKPDARTHVILSMLFHSSANEREEKEAAKALEIEERVAEEVKALMYSEFD